MWTRPEIGLDLEIVPGIGLELAVCLALIENFLDFENSLGTR